MAKKIPHTKLVLFRLDAHYRLLIALAAAVIGFFIFRGSHGLPSVILFAWIIFCAVVILLDWVTILSSHPLEVRKIAKLQDSSRTFLFLLIIGASIASFGAIIFLLKSSKGHSADVGSHILLAITGVIISWWLLHTIFTLRYAHLYYDLTKDDGTPRKGGGLEFPGNEEPDYLDFVYFSFVLGMTFQVSDVVITSKSIRRLATMHGLLSFGYNTAILALSINVISGMVAQ
ncbi:MAG TPA: DUF1345 domain-containing protein [Mucilaginibacter sp.]